MANGAGEKAAEDVMIFAVFDGRDKLLYLVKPLCAAFRHLHISMV